MAKHPCADGLTKECFSAYPKWARQALAYKLLLMMVPPALTKKLPSLLRRALVGPGAVIPAAAFLPAGIVIPPDFTVPEDWIPWTALIFAPGVDPAMAFPEGWTPADPLPPGVTINPAAVFQETWTPADPLPENVTINPAALFPATWTPADPLPAAITMPPDAPIPMDWRPGQALPQGMTVQISQVFPPGWTPYDPLPAGVTIDAAAVLPAGWIPTNPPPATFLAPIFPSPAILTSGFAPPLYVAPFQPGPIRTTPPGPGLAEYLLEINSDGVEVLTNDSLTTGDMRDTINNTTFTLPVTATVKMVDYNVIA